jgi:hypothetical protein
VIAADQSAAAVGAARSTVQVFRGIRPVNTIMQVSRFNDPNWLVEIEAMERFFAHRTRRKTQTWHRKSA